MKTPPNMAQVAKVAGVHQSTVSLALRNHRSIPPATRERIQKIAQEMGYRPNPMISALISARRSRTPQHHRSTLAYLSAFPDINDEDARRFQAETLQRLAHSAAALGYHVEFFSLRTPGMTPERMKQILLARAIRGIIVCPLMEESRRIEFDFSEFASVALGHALIEPLLDRVNGDRLAAMRLNIEKLRERGYRRITFSTPEGLDARADHLPLSAYLYERQRAPEIFLEPLFGRGWTPPRIASLMRTQRPDAIITASSKNFDHFRNALELAGYSIPGDVALTSIQRSGGGSESGTYTDREALASVAVKYIAQKIEHGEFGIPTVPRSTLIRPQWHEGNTIAPISPSAPLPQ